LGLLFGLGGFWRLGEALGELVLGSRFPVLGSRFSVGEALGVWRWALGRIWVSGLGSRFAVLGGGEALGVWRWALGGIWVAVRGGGWRWAIWRWALGRFGRFGETDLEWDQSCCS
jgi:hypothetical protein